MKKYIILLLTLFLCACQNVNANNSATSSLTLSPGISSKVTASMPEATSAVEGSTPAKSESYTYDKSKYKDETRQLYETERYAYIFKKVYLSEKDPTEPMQFTGILLRKDKNNENDSVIWQDRNFEVGYLVPYGDELYFTLDDYREFEWSHAGFMHVLDSTGEVKIEDAENICAVTNELIYCGKLANREYVLQIYSMKEKTFIGVWDNIIVADYDSDYEFECVNGILIWESEDGWNHFDYKTGVNTITENR